MHHKPAGKLCATDGHYLLHSLFAIVLIPESYFPVFYLCNPAVWNSNPMGVSAKISQYTVYPTQRFFGINIPVLLIKLFFKCWKTGKSIRYFKCIFIPLIFNQPYEDSPENSRDSFYRYKKFFGCFNPFHAIFWQSASRYQHVNMRMIRKRLSPGIIPTSG